MMLSPWSAPKQGFQAQTVPWEGRGMPGYVVPLTVSLDVWV